MTLPENHRKLEATEALGALADEAGLPLIELAIAFVVNHPAVTSAIIGPRTIEQLPAADITLDDALLDRIDESSGQASTSTLPTPATASRHSSRPFGGGKSCAPGAKRWPTPLPKSCATWSATGSPLGAADAAVTCSVLHLVLGPVNLDLLGLVVRLGGGSLANQPIVLGHHRSTRIGQPAREPAVQRVEPCSTGPG